MSMTADAPPGTDRHEGLTAADLEGLPADQQDVRLYRAMAYLRAFEERVDLLYKQGRVRGPAHLALGHEAIAVGAGWTPFRRTTRTAGPSPPATPPAP